MKEKRIFLSISFAAIVFFLFSGTEIVGIVASRAELGDSRSLQHFSNQALDFFAHALEGMNQDATISLSLDTKKYSGRGSLNALVEITTLEGSLILKDATSIHFYLYQLGKTPQGEEVYSATFIAEAPLTEKSRLELKKGQSVISKVDLTKLGWDNELASILVGKPWTDIPTGEYRVRAEIRVPDADKIAKGELALREFPSNSAMLEIKSSKEDRRK